VVYYDYATGKGTEGGDDETGTNDARRVVCALGEFSFFCLVLLLLTTLYRL
jgi:hypothetical protein